MTRGLPETTTKSLLWTGIIGAALAILCCATPALALLLGAVWLSALIGYLDYVLLPTSVVFVGIVIYALWRRKSA
jgi:mercuric ion transport protein